MHYSMNNRQSERGDCKSIILNCEQHEKRKGNDRELEMKDLGLRMIFSHNCSSNNIRCKKRSFLKRLDFLLSVSLK